MTTEPETFAWARARRWVLRSWPGRLLLLAIALRIVAAGLREAARVPPGWIDGVGTLALVAAGFGWFVQLVREARRQRLLWYVRRKLTASYIFLGFVPIALILAFFALGGLLLFFNLSAYLIEGRVKNLVEEAQFVARAAAFELDGARTLTEADDIITRRRAVEAARYPRVSFAVVPVTRSCGPGRTERPVTVPAMRKGPWGHMDPPAVPAWVPCDGTAAVVAYNTAPPATSGPPVPVQIVVRALAFPDEAVPGFAVVVDIPVTASLIAELRDETGITIAAFLPIATPDALQPRASGRRLAEETPPEVAPARPRGWLEQPRAWFAFLDMLDWETGQTGYVAATITMSPADIIRRVSATPVRIGDYSISQILFALLAVVGGLFLVIEAIAFFTGLSLARSITGSVHELVTGTSQVKRGDFTYKIPIRTEDQLGELAQSFNEMTASIETLLGEKAEKDRMHEELLVAQRIQTSLLPRGDVSVAGLDVAGVCEPARQVGGDYYDVLPLEHGRVGILVADVAGKGASAALYMAELKGLMLALSARYTSPRELLIEADRALAKHLDGRSFVTMTYGIVDPAAGTFTYARAGHCPLLFLPGPGSADRTPRLLAPEGMVLGLDLSDSGMFARLLEEDVLALAPGDVVLLFTDGVTEAMNSRQEYFGEARLVAALEAMRDQPLAALKGGLLRRLRAFVGEAEQHDDMTLVLLRLSGPGPAA
ncbi:MAG: SpoIIE family protein phosphatase [Vicinamibacterales bacterium]